MFFPEKITCSEKEIIDNSWGIIFVEAQDVCWKSIYRKIANKPCLLIFYDRNVFYRNLRNTSFVKSIRDNKDAILLLDSPIKEQVLSQSYFKTFGDPFCVDMTTIFNNDLEIKEIALLVKISWEKKEDIRFNLKSYMRSTKEKHQLGKKHYLRLRYSKPS